MRLAGIGRLVLGLIAALPIHAQEPASNLQFSAFGTVGVVGTDTHTIGFRRDQSQPINYAAIDRPNFDLDSRYGLQISAKLSESLLATLQVVSRVHADGTSKPEPMWACLAWNPVSDFQVRAGILGFEVMPNNDNSNVGYTFLWVRPPADVFGSLSIPRFQGLDVAQTLALSGDATLQVKGYYGGSIDQAPAGSLGLWDTRGGRVWGGLAKLQVGHFKGRASYSYFRLPNNLPQPVPDLQNLMRFLGTQLNEPKLAAGADTLDLRGTTFRTFQVGGVWEKGPYQAQGTYYHGGTHNWQFPTFDSGFVSFGYRIGEVVPYGIFSRYVSARPAHLDLGPLVGNLPPAFGPLVAAGQYVVASTALLADARGADQHTLSAGLRWDFASNADLKVQLDQIRSHNSTGAMADLDPFHPGGWNGHATVFSVAIDFIFGGGR